MREVFISYKSRETAPDSIDESVANELCNTLESAGITCWIAPRDIPKGSRYAAEIVNAIESCKVLLVVFSKHADRSIWISDEVRIAYESRKTICSFKVDETLYKEQWKIYLGGSQMIDARGDYSLRIPELINDLKHELGINSTQELQENVIDTQKTQKSLIDTSVIRPFTVNEVSFNMVRVEGGIFLMGATSKKDDFTYEREKPAHKVSLSSFYIGQTPVTQALWLSVMGDNPSWFTSGDVYSENELNRPVERVNWKECNTFIDKLNELTGFKFRLLTEAEWEFAARGGNKSNGYRYAGSDILEEVAWFDKNSEKQTHPVGEKLCNELGLYDMNGNVWEWCRDRFGSYSRKKQFDPMGPSSGDFYVVRGGSYCNNDDYFRLSFRGRYSMLTKFNMIGLRLALDV